MRAIRTPRDLGAGIRRLRKREGLSQAQLASSAGVGRPWLSELESGKRTAEIGLTLAVIDALGCRVELVDDDQPERRLDLDEFLDGSS